METRHQRQQREAREAKAARRDAHLKAIANDAFRRQLTIFEVDKGHLLKMLQAEGVIPESATRIVATGHFPDVLLVTVTEE